MIFLTIGSHEPFDRLVRAFDLWCAEHPETPGFAQVAHVGKDGYRPRHCDWTEKLGPADYQMYFSSAQLVVSHAGMGSIITAMNLGKSLVIMPRRGHLQETRNDHQWATVQHFAGKPGLFIAEDETKLGDAMDSALAAEQDSKNAVPTFADESLIGAVRDFIQRR